jgi:hypothetical protein
MAYDSARAVTVLFGGHGNSGLSSAETWEWDGAGWTLRPVGGPAARSFHAMTYDPARGVTIMFGGNLDNRTWEWNGEAWAARAAPGPVARETTMAFDTARGVAVLFGGYTGWLDYVRDTWELSMSCYANCDSSSTAPVLNVSDFMCFVNRFGAGDPYANCDASTSPPILNAADFTCFLNAFAAGCP